MKRFCVCLIALALLAAVTTGLATGSKFTIDVSAMPAPARETWEKLFQKTYDYAIRGNPNIDLPNAPDNKGKTMGFFPKDTVFRVTGEEPVEFWIGESKVFSTETVKREGHIVVGYFSVPKEEECWIINSDTAYKTMIYPVLDLRENRYFYDEYRLLAGYLLLPV